MTCWQNLRKILEGKTKVKLKRRKKMDIKKAINLLAEFEKEKDIKLLRTEAFDLINKKESTDSDKEKIRKIYKSNINQLEQLFETLLKRV